VKASPSYKTKIDINQLLEHPKACLVHDILSNTGTSVLVPSRIPIGKLLEGLDKPQKLIDTLDRMGIRNIEIEIPQEIDDEELMARLKELDPSVTVIDNEVTKNAQAVIETLFNQASLEEKFNIPVDVINDISNGISSEIMKTSQIVLSMVRGDLDSYTKDHALNVSMLAGYIAKKLADAQKTTEAMIDKAVQAGLLFDIGKTAIPKDILYKEGRLDSQETVIMRNHVNESVSICKASGIRDTDVLEGIATHHERYDGSGYDRGLVGTQIPLLGRILAVADTFDAMTSSRVYKSAVSSKISFNFIMSANETEFDPDICKIFIAGMGIYPPGTIVQLSDGRVATVAAMNTGNLLQPKVALKEGDSQRVIDLAAEKLFIRSAMDSD
jgi:HD-GYP domain-containing protein (c-di-GMP phosphodiesterase class II)